MIEGEIHVAGPGNRVFEGMLKSIRQIPIIDCHEHLPVPSMYVTPREPLAFLLRGYFQFELVHAGLPRNDLLLLQKDNIPTEKKWPLFKHYWIRTEHTACAREIKDTMRFYGEKDVTLESIERLGQKIRNIDEKSFVEFIESLGIKLLLDNILFTAEELKRFIKGDIALPACYRLLIPLPTFHGTGNGVIWGFGKGPWSFQGIQEIASILDKTVTSLDEYLGIVREIMTRLKERGAVGMKDQSAYYRSIDFHVATREEAERLFNKCLSEPRHGLGWPEAKPLDDFLFHECMRFARDLELSVQVHTGYPAGTRNRVAGANAALFAGVLELHQDVLFDLFHGNWPYMGDLLFLVKNYPNVYLDLCWAHLADPAYCTDLLERAVFVVSHKKINGFGGDYGIPEMIPAHLSLAQTNIARALSRHVSSGWLSKDEAINMAADWLYNNPNELFSLGLEPFYA